MEDMSMRWIYIEVNKRIHSNESISAQIQFMYSTPWNAEPWDSSHILCRLSCSLYLATYTHIRSSQCLPFTSSFITHSVWLAIQHHSTKVNGYPFEMCIWLYACVSSSFDVSNAYMHIKRNKLDRQLRWYWCLNEYERGNTKAQQSYTYL